MPYPIPGISAIGRKRYTVQSHYGESRDVHYVIRYDGPDDHAWKVVETHSTYNAAFKRMCELNANQETL